MAVELAEQLQASLGSTYTIGRELGGGGMSRVFVAEDNSLGRSVVIKVLLPELAAGVNAERFKREVQLSARLQHPHIVPVLSAGQVDGLPFYVMPFVKGDSLRARLASGPLPVNEAISILGDVAKALAYAHSDGVVHRDIKPDNILLSGGAATVADFGIAKALSSARQAEPSEGLTSLGMSLGTPAYMAPEQVAGDPSVDHRADIYSLGCVAYEMLTGQSPFAGKSPQQMLAAHVMEKPVAIDQRREGVPASLIALVNRCLAKEPAERPQSATEIVDELESASTRELASPAAARARGRVPAWALAAGVVLVAAAAVPTYRSMHHAPADDGVLSVAVAPFEVLDPNLALWKEGIVDVMSRNVDGAGPIRAIPPSAAIKRWEGHGDRTTATAFGQRLGARLVVYGQIQSAGRDLVDAKAWVVDVRSSAQPIEVSVHDSVSRMDRVSDSLSIKVLSAIGRDHPIGAARLASLGSGSLPAIKAFLQGAQYFRRTQWDSAAVSFKEAVAHDSTFGIAYLHLAQSLGWLRGAGDPEATAADLRAGNLVRAGLSPHDSLLLTAVGHLGKIGQNGRRNPSEMHAAVGAAQAAADRYPNDPEAWYLLGDIRYHDDPTITDREALSYFTRAIAADSAFAPAYVHAIELSYRYGAEAGRRLTDAYLRLDPRDVEGEGLRLAARMADSRANPRELQAVLDTVNPGVAQKAFGAIQRMPDSSEAALQIIRTAVRRIPPASAGGVNTALIFQLGLRGRISEAWELAVKNKNFTAGEFVALGLIPLDSGLKVIRPWLALQSDAFLAPLPALAMAHDTAALLAQQTLLEGALKRNPSNAGPMTYVISSIRAYTALARGDTATATTLFGNIGDSVVNMPIDQFTRARLVGRTDPARAIAILEKHTAMIDVLQPARELERARLAEKTGDRERAVDAYAYVAGIWQRADSPPLRDAVKEANEALRRLDADGRVRAQLVQGPKR